MHGDIVIYGAEDRQGRALLAISALHHCARWLLEKKASVRFIAVDSVVCTALEVLRFNTGLKVAADSALPRERPDEAFANARLYVGVVFSRPYVLALDEARKRSVPCLAAVQFPKEQHLTVNMLENLRCAFDPAELSRRLCSEVLRLERRKGKP